MDRTSYRGNKKTYEGSKKRRLLVKLPDQRLGLPGNVISLHIVPLDPAYRQAGKAGLPGHFPVNGNCSREGNGIKLFSLNESI